MSPQRPPDNIPELLILDGTAMLFRSYYSMRFQGRNGMEVGAMLGVTQALAKLSRLHNLDHVLIAFDAGQKTFRNELDPRYKANRGAPPEDLIPQFEGVRDVVDALGFCTVCVPGFEADDLMATAAAIAADCGARARVRALDKDLWQVVSDSPPAIVLEDPRTNETIREEEVRQRFGVQTWQLRDYFALIGDSSDNIPGAPGVGPKTAVGLLRHFQTLEDIFANLNEIETLSFRGAKTLGPKLQSAHSEVKLAQQLVTLRYDAPLGISDHSLLEATQWSGPVENAAERFRPYGFEGGLRSLESFAYQKFHR